MHEEKKKYNKRVIDVEHGTFTLLIFSTTGGMGKENMTYHKRLAALIAQKRNENYYVVHPAKNQVRATTIDTNWSPRARDKNTCPKKTLPQEAV